MEMDESTETRSVEFPLRRPAFWNPTLLGIVGGVLGGVLLGFLPLRGNLSHDGTAAQLGIALAVGGGIALVAIVVWAIARPKGVPPIRLEKEALFLPRRAHSRRVKRVPYGDVLSFDLRFKRRRRLLVIGTRTALFFYRVRAFTRQDTPEAFREHLRRFIEAAPGGRDQWARMVEREERAKSATARRPVATIGLLAAIASVFIVALVLGIEEQPLVLVDLGANASVLVREGQWYRLAAANFLHASVLHVGLNVVALLLLGVLVERISGTQRFLLVFLVSALVGSAASTLAAEAVVSVGASTGIFGLLGALAVLNWRFRTDLPAGFRQPGRWWVLIVGINALLPALVPQIDVAAHAGGLAAGALVMLALYRHQGSLDVLEAPSRVVAGATAAVCLVFVIGLGFAAQRAVRESEDDQLRVAEVFVAGAYRAVVLNNVAWGFVIDEGASDRALELARQLAEQAVDMEPDNPVLLDTLATAHYRLGALDDAIAVERKAIRHRTIPSYATQLARFLRARQADGRPILLGGAAESDVWIRVEPGTEAAVSSWSFPVNFEMAWSSSLMSATRAERSGSFGPPLERRTMRRTE